jgi:hypothetical protein
MLDNTIRTLLYVYLVAFGAALRNSYHLETGSWGYLIYPLALFPCCIALAMLLAWRRK